MRGLDQKFWYKLFVWLVEICDTPPLGIEVDCV
jgi:hypothetical protein